MDMEGIIAQANIKEPEKVINYKAMWEAMKDKAPLYIGRYNLAFNDLIEKIEVEYGLKTVINQYDSLLDKERR